MRSPLRKRLSEEVVVEMAPEKFIGDVSSQHVAAEPYISAVEVKPEIEWPTRKAFFLDCLMAWPWSFVARMGCPNALEVAKKFQYECPWTRNRYSSFMPIAVETDDLAKFRPYLAEGSHYLLDADFMASQRKTYTHECVDPIIESFLGHGFQSRLLPTDGATDLTLAAIDFEDGDRLIGWMWVWYDKHSIANGSYVNY